MQVRMRADPAWASHAHHLTLPFPDTAKFCHLLPSTDAVANCSHAGPPAKRAKTEGAKPPFVEQASPVTAAKVELLPALPAAC